MNPSISRRWIFLVALLVARFLQAQAQTAPAPPPAAATVAEEPPLTPAMVSPTRGPRQELRLQNIQLHDPWILADKERKIYYLYSSAQAGITGLGRTGTLFYRSKDLLNWDGPYIAFIVQAESWADPRRGAWAPEVHEFKGKFYLFTTLHNPQKVLAPTVQGAEPKMMRSTMIAVSDSPEGPFKLLKTDNPVAPENFMTLDGTLYVDPEGKPWMVYAHEWVQKMDGTFEAVPLKDDLSAASGPPIYLFKASDAPWINEQATPSASESHRVTDGCEMFRTKDGRLLMLWSSYDKDGYVQTVARSKTGNLKGPWEQLEPLVKNDTGHGMLFTTFEGQLMLVTGQPFNNQRAKIYEMEDLGDNLRVVKFREDLNGPPLGPNARQQRGQRAGGAATPAPAAAPAVAPAN